MPFSCKMPILAMVSWSCHHAHTGWFYYTLQNYYSCFLSQIDNTVPVKFLSSPRVTLSSMLIPCFLHQSLKGVHFHNNVNCRVMVSRGEKAGWVSKGLRDHFQSRDGNGISSPRSHIFQGFRLTGHTEQLLATCVDVLRNRECVAGWKICGILLFFWMWKNFNVLFL